MMADTLKSEEWELVEPELTENEFLVIVKMLHKHSGISLGEESRPLVISRLSKNLRRLGFSSFSQYIDLIQQCDQNLELYRMITSLTTHTTKFFREIQHFRYLEQNVMPRLSQLAREGKKIRFWSAGCSTGEEAYSIAATILRALPDAGQYDVRVLATDISREVLSVAETGCYRNFINSDIPSDILPILFEAEMEGEFLRVTEKIRELVTFRYMNFIEPWPISSTFDVIFCRNVAIYMSEDTQRNIWQGLVSVLGPQGVLCIGHSERLGSNFNSILELCEKTTFRRVEPKYCNFSSGVL